MIHLLVTITNSNPLILLPSIPTHKGLHLHALHCIALHCKTFVSSPTKATINKHHSFLLENHTAMTTRNPSKAEELKRTHRPAHRTNGFRVSSEEAALMQGPSLAAEAKPSAVEESGRERLKRHRVEVAGRVWIPDRWGQEELLKGLLDCNAFDASLMNSSILSARAALVEEVRTANSGALRIENRC